MSGDAAHAFQEDHADRGGEPPTDAVLPAGVYAHAREHAARLPQGALRTLLCLLLRLGLWWMYVPGSGGFEFDLKLIHLLFYVSNTTEIARCYSGIWLLVGTCEVTEILAQRSIKEASFDCEMKLSVLFL